MVQSGFPQKISMVSEPNARYVTSSFVLSAEVACPKNPSHVHECKLDQDQKTFLALARESRVGRLATNVEE